jgi:nucleotide-binding universal stress UspA family protein
MMLAIALLLVGLLIGCFSMIALQRERLKRTLRRRTSAHRIAFPFTGEALSEPALMAALRIARAEDATLMAVYLAMVPMRLEVDVPLQSECGVAVTLLEAIEQRAARLQVSVDSRVERGRTIRHALRELMAHDTFDRMVVAASTGARGDGFTPEDIAWLMEHLDGELIALRPAISHPDTVASLIEI